MGTSEKINLEPDHAFRTKTIVGFIDQIESHQVMDHELEALGRTSKYESLALSMASGASGVFVSCVIAWTTSQSTTPDAENYTAMAVLVGITGLSFIVGLIAWIVWGIIRRGHTDLISKIKERSIMVEMTQDGQFRRVRADGLRK